MTFWTDFGSPLIATALGGFPAVFAGVWLERIVASRRDTRIFRSKLKQSYQSLVAGGNLLYDMRNWARSIRDNAQQSRPLGVNTQASGSVFSLRAFVSGLTVKPESLSGLMAIIDRAEILHRIVDPLTNHVASGNVAAMIEDEAAWVAKFCDMQILESQQQLQELVKHR